MADRYDAVVVGGGHNGLVCAAYLAKAGLRVVVLERRTMVGGACVTEEIFPGYKVCTAAQIGGLLKTKIIGDLELEKFGFGLVPFDPHRLHLFPDGRYIQSWRDPAKSMAEVAKFSERDAQAYLNFEKQMDRLASIMKPSLELRPPLSVGEVEARFAEAGESRAFREIMFGSMKGFLDSRFESEEVKASIAPRGMTGIGMGPMSAGSAYMMLHYWPEPGTAWGRVPGGMGTITQAIAGAARFLGAEVYTDAEVESISVMRGRAVGVELRDGRKIEAKVVISNADPKRTFQKLVEPEYLDSDFLNQVEGIAAEGMTFNIHFAMSGLPEFKAFPGRGAGPQHQGLFWIAPTVEYLERAWDEAKFGQPAREPYLTGIIHSVMDPLMAPPGKHYMTVYGQWAPYHLKEGDWDSIGDRYVKHCVELMTEYIPNLKEIIDDYFFVSPKELEDRIFMSQGHMFHGECVPGQVFQHRPFSGWADYRTPIGSLYLCGAGTHPGGTVTGAPGHNAAHEILRDWKEGVVG